MCVRERESKGRQETYCVLEYELIFLERSERTSTYEFLDGSANVWNAQEKARGRIETELTLCFKPGKQVAFVVQIRSIGVLKDDVLGTRLSIRLTEGCKIAVQSEVCLVDHRFVHSRAGLDRQARRWSVGGAGLGNV